MRKQELQKNDIVLYYETELVTETDWIPVYDDFGYCDDEPDEKITGADIRDARLAMVVGVEDDTVCLDFMNEEPQVEVDREQVYPMPDANRFVLNYIKSLLYKEPVQKNGTAYQKK